MTNLDILLEVQKELQRFTEKVALAIKEQSGEPYPSNRAYAAAKRGALDLKAELSKLTQDTKYKYQKP
jgi:hypothetical protein